MTLLWLDDYRNPFVNDEGRVPEWEGDIRWVKNYEEFTQWITEMGLPDMVSFDHDLADEHYVPEEYWDDYRKSKIYQEQQVYKEKTGYECAKWLVNYCLDNLEPLPKWNVHSANPVGSDNIKGLLTSYGKII